MYVQGPRLCIDALARPIAGYYQATERRNAATPQQKLRSYTTEAIAVNGLNKPSVKGRPEI